MGKKIRKIKNIRIHREGTNTLTYSMVLICGVAALLWYGFDTKWPFWLLLVVTVPIWAIVLNFYRCPIRYLNMEDTEGVVVAPADGKVVSINATKGASVNSGDVIVAIQ